MSLDKLLSDETRLVEDFIACLKRERHQLAQEKIVDLQAITDQKNQLIGALLSISENRSEVLRQSGLPDTGEGLKTWLSLYGSVEGQQAYEKLRTLSIEAKQLNEINAKMVGQRLQATQQALSILLPQEQAPTLYNPYGQSSQRSNFKIIDSA